mmetsp:Transcript_67080/g.216330  ORF Transcript_67080/g.216330 Transcript_67080/m.216330 type:complete len:361 (+) Transcript_67080:180-1262(+)
MVQQQHRGPVPRVADAAADALVHPLHALGRVEVAAREPRHTLRVACVKELHLFKKPQVARIWVRQAHDSHKAAQVILEVYAFAELGAVHSEQQCTALTPDGCSEGPEGAFAARHSPVDVAAGAATLHKDCPATKAGTGRGRDGSEVFEGREEEDSPARGGLRCGCQDGLELRCLRPRAALVLAEVQHLASGPVGHIAGQDVRRGNDVPAREVPDSALPSLAAGQPEARIERRKLGARLERPAGEDDRARGGDGVAEARLRVQAEVAEPGRSSWRRRLAEDAVARSGAEQRGQQLRDAVHGAGGPRPGWAGRLRGLHVPADLARQLRPVQEAAQLREVEVLGPEAHEEGADRLGARPHQAR